MAGRAPQGWYPDPDGSGGLRWWDGQRWTSYRSPASTPRPSRAHRGWLAIAFGAVGAVLVAGAGLAAVGAATEDDPAAVAEDAGTVTPDPTPSEQPAPAPPTPRATPSSPPPPTSSAPSPRPQRARPGTALALLAALAVKGRAPRTGYDRDRFGQAWLDTDRNGCDTRNDMLRRDLTGVRLRPGTQGCVVEAGTLADPFSGAAVGFVRGSSQVDIDHVVSLSNAWQSGAARWPISKRAAFANDPMNLLAVDASLNRQKGDGDTATWLPPNKAYRCAYVARQVSVKAKYGLWVTPPERDAMRRVLARCPAQPALRGGAPVISPVEVNEPRRSTTPPPRPVPLQSGGSRVHYENCDAVRAAGADPIRSGDPGFGDHLDRDKDGVACER